MNDVELISMASLSMAELELDDAIQLKINSLGDFASREAHRKVLVEYLEAHRASLSPDSVQRYHHEKRSNILVFFFFFYLIFVRADLSAEIRCVCLIPRPLRIRP